MKVMLDLNVLLDVIQHRTPHYTDSAQVIDAVIRKVIEGIIPSHSVTTLYFITAKHTMPEKAREMLQWLLAYYSIESANHLLFEQALQLDFEDYEDAVVHTLAENANCDAIITRNTKDYTNATLPIFTPTQFLEQLEIL